MNITNMLKCRMNNLLKPGMSRMKHTGMPGYLSGIVSHDLAQEEWVALGGAAPRLPFKDGLDVAGVALSTPPDQRIPEHSEWLMVPLLAVAPEVMMRRSRPGMGVWRSLT